MVWSCYILIEMSSVCTKHDRAIPFRHLALEQFVPETLSWRSLKGSQVQYPAAPEDLFVFRQPTWPELSNSPDIMIYGRRRLPELDRIELRQDRDYSVLQAQWTKGAYHVHSPLKTLFLSSFLRSLCQNHLSINVKSTERFVGENTLT